MDNDWYSPIPSWEAARTAPSNTSWIIDVVHQISDAVAVPSSAPEQPTPLPSPGWFTQFLADRAVRKPSPHTTKAYRQDFEAIAILIVGSADAVAHLHVDQVAKESLRAAFAAYADTHSAASIRRCWSTWNTLCTFLYTAELLDANPMPLIGRPKVPRTLPTPPTPSPT